MRLFLLLFISFSSVISYGQNVGIGTNVPHASAALEIQDTSRGILIPRMTMVQRNAIANPAEGLMVYQTDSTRGFWYNSDSNWIHIKANSANSTFSSVGATMKIFTSTTNFTIPDGVNSVIVELWGAGGGASGGHEGVSGAWGKQSINVTPGMTYLVEVGVGGGVGGGSGSSSSFNGIFAQGGRGGCGWCSPTPNPVSNAQLWCHCAVPIGSTLGFGIRGTSNGGGANGLVIITY